MYVDDILLTSDSVSTTDVAKRHLDSLFTIKDLGLASFFLDIEIATSFDGLLFHQQKYITDVLQDVGLLNVKPYSFSLWPQA